jgi:hypothetical protein
MTADIELSFDVDAGLLARCDDQQIVGHAEARLQKLLAGLNVDGEATVAVRPTKTPDAIGILRKGPDVIGTFSAENLTTMSVLGVPVDLSVLEPHQTAASLGSIACHLAALDVPALLGGDGIAQFGVRAEIAQFLLDLWIRVPDEPVFAQATEQFGDETRPDLPEALVTQLRPAEVRLRVAPDYLRALTGLPHENAFAYARTRLRSALGVAPPLLHFEASSEVAEQLIEPVVNDVQMLPVHGLATDMVIAAEYPDRLRRAGIAAEPMNRSDPDQPRSIVSTSDLERLDDTCTYWNAVEVIAAWWEAFAPSIAWRTFDQRDIERAIARLRPTLPVIARAAEQVPASHLAAPLRMRYREDSELLALPIMIEIELRDQLLQWTPAD